MNKSRAGYAILVLVLLGAAAACEEPIGMRTEHQTVAPNGAKQAEVTLRMSAGQLRVAGAAQDALLEATFRYNRERLKPEIDYHVSGSTGILNVEPRRHHGIYFGHTRNEWDLELNRSIPLELAVKLGAGESRLDLRGLDLSGVDIDMGVGEMRVDLSGRHSKGFSVKVDGGVGSGSLILPSGVGARVRVSGGIGSVNAHGLRKSGHEYTNDAYGKSDVTIDVRINAGIGSLDLRVESGESAKF